jgi:transposase
VNQLSRSECYQELAAALQSANDDNRLPIQALLLFYFGYTPDYLITELNITTNDFRKWLQQYTIQGLTAFTSQEKVVPDKYQVAVKEALASPPPEMFASGFDFWTVETLAKFLTWKIGIPVTVAEMKRLLKAMGYRTKRFYRIEV